MAHCDLNALFLHKREPLFRNGTQPHQNLGRPWTTMSCFAMQFEIFLKKETIF